MGTIQINSISIVYCDVDTSVGNIIIKEAYCIELAVPFAFKYKNIYNQKSMQTHLSSFVPVQIRVYIYIHLCAHNDVLRTHRIPGSLVLSTST